MKRLRCESCSTEVEGLYDLPILASLSNEDQDFILQFVKADGSLKEMARASRCQLSHRTKPSGRRDRNAEAERDAEKGGAS